MFSCKVVYGWVAMGRSESKRSTTYGARVLIHRQKPIQSQKTMVQDSLRFEKEIYCMLDESVPLTGPNGID